MANKTLNVTLLLRSGTAAEWSSANPVLNKSEMGVESDTRKFKFGDGTTAWNELAYANGGQVVVRDAAPATSDSDFDIGTIWLNTANNTAYMLFAKTPNATWIELASRTGTVASAEKLKTPRKITLNGAVESISRDFDGSANITFELILAASGVSSGTYTKLTVNEKGIVTAATKITAADIPELTLAKITDAGTAASRNVGTASGNIPVLDAQGKLNVSVIPALAISETFEVASQAAMLELTAQKGDIAIRTDENKTYILAGDTPSTLDNWKLLRTPTDAVLSVNGKTGAVTLTTDDIQEGATHLYYTEQRATANFKDNIAKTTVAEMQNGAHVLMDTDTLVLNGGTAS